MDKSIFSDYKILIVDDDIAARSALFFNLKEQMGFGEVYSAQDGFEGLELLDSFAPDIIMTDIAMPKMDGLEMVTRIKEIDAQIPIVILSAFDSSEFLIKAINLGVNNFIIKPSGMKRLKGELEKIVSMLAIKKEAETSRSMLENYKKLIDVSNIVSMTDEKGVITYVNDKFCQTSKYTREELIGKSHNIVRHPETPKSAFADMWRDIKEGKTWHGVLKNRAKDGSTYLVDSTIAPIVDKGGKRNGYLAIRHDLTDLFNKDEIIKQQSIDALTNLGSRVKLIEDIHASKNPMLMIVNIDDFSSVNETFGTKFGDNLIVEVAKRFVSVVNKGMMLYRMYADEFALLIDDCCSSDDWDGFLEQTVSKLSTEGYMVHNQEIDLSFTAGVAKGSGNIINRANIAYRHAKNHKDPIYFFNDKLKEDDARREENIKWNTEVKRALNDDDILSFFQPIYSYENSAIEKYETLVRLRDKEGKIISPYYFLDVAKRSKLYGAITKKMFLNTIKTAEYYPNKEFSINLSILDLSNNDTVAYIFEGLEQCKCAENIVFEITEQESLDYRIIKDFAKRVKGEFGSKVAIDDFGSGYSNFEHLIEIDLDYLKIDGSIIKKIITSKESLILTEAIISFSKKLNIKTVAEFVSSKEIFDKLKEIGIDFAQGYYIGAPEDWVRESPILE